MADDLVKLAPRSYKIILENDKVKVRVLDFKLKPRDKVEMDSHPPYFVYVMSASDMRFTLPNGEGVSVRRDHQIPGTAFWHGAGSHAVENVDNEVPIRWKLSFSSLDSGPSVFPLGVPGCCLTVSWARAAT